jgi:hypothetical protein
MAEQDAMRDAKNYFVETPMKSEPFFLRGANSLDWGFKNRLSNIFHPETGRTVMLAIDHGYFLGPTEGLERVDLTIVPLLPYADTLMCTRGILRSTIPPTFTKGIVLRSSGGPSILKELSNEEIAVDIEDAIRLNVAAMAVQVFIGGEHETRSVHNMTRLVDIGNRYGIPVLGVTAVGKDMVGHEDMRRTGRRVHKDLLCRQRIRYRDRVLSRPDRDRRREETARTGCVENGLQRRAARSRRGRHGTEHLPIRSPCRDDPGGKKSRSREGNTRGSVRRVSDPEEGDRIGPPAG